MSYEGLAALLREFWFGPPSRSTGGERRRRKNLFMTIPAPAGAEREIWVEYWFAPSGNVKLVSRGRGSIDVYVVGLSYTGIMPFVTALRTRMIPPPKAEA